MRILIPKILFLIILFAAGTCRAQDDTGPVMIKINRIIFAPGNKYSLYIPTFEFHMFFQKEFDVIKSAITADYDYRRGDMGFGMSHAFVKYAVNPGVSVDDDLYFREVFSDSTGIWRRKQAVRPFLMHHFNENASTGLEFKIEREWSPKRRMGTKIVSNHDRSLKIFYLYHTPTKQNRLFYISLERSYKIFKGEFNYFLIELLGKLSADIGENFQYKGILNYRGNLTPQTSPLYFLGGRNTLIGFENDELWGRRAFNIQNLLEFSPIPDFVFDAKYTEFRRFSFLMQCDIGKVSGSAKIQGFKSQTDKPKIGLGVGLGFNTDLPYMPSTDIHFIMAFPSTDYDDVKYYAGFGGWLD